MKVDVARVIPTDATQAEPARVFLQSRIRLWAFWVFVLSFGFYLTNLLTWPIVRQESLALADVLLHAGSLDHLAASSVFGGVWLLTRFRRLSMAALRRIEVAALITGCFLFALMSVYLANIEFDAGAGRAIGAFSGLLACANTVIARAIVVPSTPARTFIASTVAMAPLVPAAVVSSQGSMAMGVNQAAWCAVSIAVSTVGSRVIFGLRSEAARSRRLGQYTIEHQIGSGGMGIVYRASHAMLRRPTAIKLLPPDRAGEAALARFEREVQLTAELSHPNTVAIYDYGRTPEGIFYYAMEYLDGIDLEDLVRLHGPQPAARVVAILDQVCGALVEAHERGLVHRDIKPANIILTERGGEPDVAKVVDFGLVKPLASDAPDAMTQSASSVITGTPLYMSPEAMVTPGAGDPRSDLYALGAVAYYLLAGAPIFEAATAVEIVGHHLHTEPTPPSVRLGRALPAGPETIVLQCLRKDPDERPASARALREMLRNLEIAGAPWTSDDAAEWWRRFRAAGPPATPASERTEQPGLTVTVDVDDRVTRYIA